MSEVVRDGKGNFDGWAPRECGEHRTVGDYRAWCFHCQQWCYPRIAAACNGCRLPVTDKLMDDLAEALGGLMTRDDDEIYEKVEAVMARYRAYKESE